MSDEHGEPLAGKVALVTGGSRGLGREMVLAFADAGADVVVASRKLDTCQEVAGPGRGQGPARAARGASTSGTGTRSTGLVEQAYGAFGHVDVLVNNAGMSPLYPDLTAVTEELWDKVDRRQPQRSLPPHRAGRHPDGGRHGRLHHQRLDHRLAASRPRHAPLRRRQGGPEHPHRGLRQGLRPHGAGQLHHGRPVPHRHRGELLGTRPCASTACRTTRWVGQANRPRSSAPPSTSPPTPRRSPPAPSCASTEGSR